MMNEKVVVQIGNRQLAVEMEGWTPIEITALAQKVTERLVEMQNHHSKIADTSKIALLLALSYAAELNRECAAHDMTRRILESKVESFSKSLKESLQAGADSNE